MKRSDGHQAGIYGIGTSRSARRSTWSGKVVAEMSPTKQRAQVVVTATMFTDALITAADGVHAHAPVHAARRAAARRRCSSVSRSGSAATRTRTRSRCSPSPAPRCACSSPSYFAIRALSTDARATISLACGACAAAALAFRVSAALFLPVIGSGCWRPRGGSHAACATRGRVRRPGTPRARSGRCCCCSLVNWWRYGSATNFGYALGTATNQSYPIVRGVLGQWLSSGKSIFLFAPIAVIVVLGLGRSFKKLPMEMVLLGGLVVVNTLFFARVQFWSGDWAWGPRYMQIVVPCLAAMAAPLMDSSGGAARSWR